MTTNTGSSRNSRQIPPWVDAIVLHPDTISAPALYRPLGRRLALENMDTRKRTGHTADDLHGLFALLPPTKVTIHQLLTHTGGTGDIFGPDFDAHRKELRALADYVKLYGKRGLDFEPGGRWAYSNYGFFLLGVVIEEVTGQSYYDYLQAHIHAPAGMTGSGSLPEHARFGTGRSDT